jgi:hypothetical protein
MIGMTQTSARTLPRTLSHRAVIAAWQQGHRDRRETQAFAFHQEGEDVAMGTSFHGAFVSAGQRNRQRASEWHAWLRQWPSIRLIRAWSEPDRARRRGSAGAPHPRSQGSPGANQHIARDGAVRTRLQARRRGHRVKAHRSALLIEIEA